MEIWNKLVSGEDTGEGVGEEMEVNAKEEGRFVLGHGMRILGNTGKSDRGLENLAMMKRKWVETLEGSASAGLMRPSEFKGKMKKSYGVKKKNKWEGRGQRSLQ